MLRTDLGLMTGNHVVRSFVYSFVRLMWKKKIVLLLLLFVLYSVYVPVVFYSTIYNNDCFYLSILNFFISIGCRDGGGDKRLESN